MPAVNVRHKKTVSVTLDPALLQQARAAGLNLSSVLTTALEQEISATGILPNISICPSYQFWMHKKMWTKQRMLRGKGFISIQASSMA